MKRLFAKKSADWGRFFGLRVSSKQKEIDEEIHEQINEKGIYTIFDKSNSREEIGNRLREKENESWKRAGIVFSGISVFFAIAKFFLNA